MPDAANLINLISNSGLVGLLVLIIVGGSKRLWVFGWVYDSLEKEKEEWKELALSGTNIAERATTAAEALSSHKTTRGTRANSNDRGGS